MKKQSYSVKNASRPLRIGFVFDDSLDSTDGVSQYVKTLGAWLTKQGHQVSYLVGETRLKQWEGCPVFSLSKNQKVSFNSNKLSIPLPADSKKIKKVLRDGNYDVLHIQMPHSPFMAGRIIKYADAATAIIGTFHILPANKLVIVGSRLLRLLYGASLKRFDTVLSVSSAAAVFAKNAFGITSEVLPNVVDVKKFHSAPKQRNTETRIVFLGRLVKRKGCFELLRAYELARNRGLTAKLIIAGKGPEKPKLERYVQERNLTQSVEFLGFIDEQDKPSLLADADIACFPAIGGESFGIVLIEAMAAGSKVVLGGDNPGYRTVLGGKPILLIDPNDTEGFAERLTALLHDKPLREDIDRWLRTQVVKYDVEAVGEKLLSTYQSVIAKRHANLHNINYE